MEGRDRNGTSPWIAAATLLAAGATAWFGTGCADVVQARAMAHAEGSPEAVARAALDALEDSSEAGLNRLLLTREEHRTLLWPQLPERNTFPFDYIRELTMRDTREAIDRGLRSWGGADFELLRVEFTEEPERYEGFTIHTGARVRVRRASDGREGYIEFLDGLVEWNGRWKAFNYRE